MKDVNEFKDIAALVNELRVENKNKVFTVKQLEEVLGGILPTNCLAKSALVKSEVIIRMARGRYCFPQSPIHWTKIKNFYDTCRERQRTYSKAEDYLYGKPIATIIRDLKSLGYWVLKPM